MITVLSFIAVLGFLVFVHELGHYLAARHVGVRVETFSIGFPPKIWSKKVGETEYTISWIPLGGYVKLFGQNLDDEDPTQPQNYAAKSPLQKLYILIAGPAMNFFIALLFMPIFYLIGTDLSIDLKQPVILDYFEKGGFSEQVDLQKGDQIVAINGLTVSNWSDFRKVAREQNANTPLMTIEVDRQGEQISVVGEQKIFLSKGLGAGPLIEPIVGKLVSGSPAEKAGLQEKDRILAINETSIAQWQDISKVVQNSQTNALNKEGVALTVTVERAGNIEVLQLTPYYHPQSKSFKIGMGPPTYHHSYPLDEAFQLGMERLQFMFLGTMKFLGDLLGGKGSLDDLGGPVRIGSVVGEAAQSSFADLLLLTAFISLQLGILNLLPIPALDGGHIFFLLVEKVKGTPLSPAIREKTQMLGVSLLFLLMIVVTFNDIRKLWL